MRSDLNHAYRYNIGFVLSGGGARGFAHAGAIKAFNEFGIFPEIISGTSAGALVGAFYADGMSPDNILHLFQEKKFFRYMELSLPKQDLLKMNGLGRIIAQNLSAKTFEELKIPLIVCSTDITNGKGVYFSKGELFKSIIASASVPVIFAPLVIGNTVFVDGGIFDNFPMQPIIKKCRHIVGINVNPTGIQNDFSRLVSIAERTFHLSFTLGLAPKIKKCSIFIEPPELQKYRLMDISKSKEIFRIGYKYTKSYLTNNPDKIKALLNKIS